MIKYLLKFVSDQRYAENLMDGTLYMRPASYYHALEMGQGDMREAAISDTTAIYKNPNIPIYCMYAIQDNDIIDGNIFISERCIKDFRCEDGCAVKIEFAGFEKKLTTLCSEGYEVAANLVNYHKITAEDTMFLLSDKTVCNLFVKHPYFSYQKEFRIVVARQAYKINEPAVDHVEYRFASDLRDISSIYTIADLQQKNGNYILPV